MNVEAVPRKLFADCIDMNFCPGFGMGNSILKSRSFVGTVCVLCHTCFRKARDVLGAGEVLGHSHDSFIDVN